MINSKKILSVDPSITCAGYAVFDVFGDTEVSTGGETLLEYDVCKTKSTDKDRFKTVARFFSNKIAQIKPDVLIIETAYTGSFIGAGLSLSKIIGAIEALFMDKIEKGQIILINPSSITSELGIKMDKKICSRMRREYKKKAVVDFINKFFGLTLTEKETDKADAIAIGFVGISKNRQKILKLE